MTLSPHTQCEQPCSPHQGHHGLEEDPVCIVGMACRLPGGVRSPADLWQFLLKKKSAQGVVPPVRYNIKGYYSQEGDKAGVMNVEGGYFLQEDVRQFDNEFFGINNFEATYAMDPQQRKLLEVIFECFENAGSSLDDMSGSNTGVYVGNFSQDHLHMQVRDPDDLRRYHATGAGLTMLANRVSHVFNLHGPSLTLDTACSSSIYCLHLAVAALKASQCDGAIVAASNLIMTPAPHIAAMKAGMLSPTSTCHTFDISADGYARGEGVDAIYLKRLSSAIQNNDNIHAIIRGTAINSNGHTPGMVYPSAEFQEAVIRKAYHEANLKFSGTDYIECHGTGTELGDVVELTALASCFSPGRSSPLKIGGTKPSFGHSEAASSLTSVIKVSMAFGHGVLAPTRGVKTINPKLDLSRHNMEVVTETQPWPREIQRASVCSFGYGGANAHAILESYNSYTSQAAKLGVQSAETGLCFVLPVSAASTKALEDRTNQVLRAIQSSDTHSIERLSYTLAERVTNFKFRTSLLLTHGPSQIEEKWEIDPVDVSNPNQVDPLDFAFVFTGQGAQYHGMGKELLENNLIFLATIRELDQVIQGLPPQYLPDWTFEDTLRGLCDTNKIHEVTRSQPVCTAVQVGLVNILHSWGVSPVATVGHSSGEIAAAYASGIISASQAIIAAYFRGYAVAQEPTHGAMLACGIAIEEAESLIQELGFSGQVCVACINSSESVTLSGLQECIDAIQSELQVRKRFCRRLATGGQAYHSPWMKTAGANYEQLLSSYFQNMSQQSPLKAKMYSTVEHNNGPVIIEASTKMAKYWRNNLESPVLFEPTLSHLIQKRRLHIVEIGPHSTLKGPINQIRITAKLDTRVIPYSPSLIRNQDAHVCMKRLAGRLFVDGHELKWHVINPVPEQNRVVFRDLPPYPWDYSTGLRWFEPRASIELRNRTHIRHELLGSQQLAGSGIDWSWRNVLRVDEMPWFRDHNIDGQVIFPAAGYLAVTIEAASRVQATREGSRVEHATFEFRNVCINSALVLPEKDDLHAPIELHTAMSLRRLSAKKFSANIYEFTISSWAGGQSVVHCVGNVTVLGASLKKTVLIPGNDLSRTWTMDRWYERYREEGMFFGTYFQTLTGVRADRNQLRPAVQCTTQICPSRLEKSATSYSVHPVTIDACLQAAQISATCGNPDAFRVYVPVFISECRVQKRPTLLDSDRQGVIHAQSHPTGFSTLRADCVLEDSQGVPVIEMKGVQLLKYMGRVNKNEIKTNPYLERHPALQVRWKPDITRLAPDTIQQLEIYIENFIKQNSSTNSEQEVSTTIGVLLDLAGHKNPRMRVLQIGTGHEGRINQWLNMLSNGTVFPRLRSWQSVRLDDTDQPSIQNSNMTSYNVLVHDEKEAQGLWDCQSTQLISLIEQSSIVITHKSDAALAKLSDVGFSTMVIRDQVILAMPIAKRKVLDGQSFLLLSRKTPSRVQPFFTKLENLLFELGASSVFTVSPSQVETIEISENVVCISLLEIEEPFFATLSQEDLNMLHSLTNTVKHIVWLTGANMLGAPNPDLALVQGMSRALMVEQPSLRFTVMDVGSPEALYSDLSNSCTALIRVLMSSENDDKEFILSDGLLYISRFEPNNNINSLFQRRIHREHTWEKLPLSVAQPARLSIGKVGLTDTIHFQQLCEPYVPPPQGYIDVQVKAVSLNAKDIYTMSGHVETRTGTSAIEFGGLVTAIGPGVTNVDVGDRVVVVTPNKFSTTERVPSWTAHKLLPNEEYGVMASLPTIYCAALYAIRDRAQLRGEESVLIHSGAGAFGIAAITIAQRAGAVVYTTTSSAEKRKYLVNNLGIPDTHIFNSRDDSFVAGLMAITRGRGVDVVVNALAGDLMHASWRCLAPFGRFIEVGKRELVDDGRLEMNVFARNTTFTAFDLTEMYFQEGEHYKGVVTGLIKDVFELYRANQIQHVPIKTYDVADIAQAHRYFSSKDRIGKVVVSLEDPNSLLTVAPSNYLTIFDCEKVYLLVGALGGLGRSLTQWMVSRGAKKFVFLQRSGCDKPGAREFVDYLERNGVHLTVVKGDVTVLDDVVAGVTACKALGGPLGGVVQAAMGLHEDLFSRMTAAGWHASVRPKLVGTRNLHTAIDGYDDSLDFFLMMSSMNGSVGTPTESNYCAANAFLDAFAFWRRSQGKPATSLGLGLISEVGYLHDNPEIEALLLRRGVQPLNESTLLQLVDLAIGGTGKAQQVDPDYELPAHILTGLETTRIRNFFEQGFEVSSSVMDDPRSSILEASLEASLNARHSSENGVSDVDKLTMNIPWLNGLPQGVGKILGAEKSAPTLNEAILGVLKRRFSHLLLTPIDQIDHKRSFAQFGLDSMIAAEFRTWIWNSLKVEVPFLDLLSPQKSLESLAAYLEKELTKM
ncbi:polyketide synthase-like protein [Ustulina deusta]|nr:polyketide synthase-like protein [Ustulina deusta]